MFAFSNKCSLRSCGARAGKSRSEVVVVVDDVTTCNNPMITKGEPVVGQQMAHTCKPSTMGPKRIKLATGDAPTINVHDEIKYGCPFPLVNNGRTRM